MKCILMRGLPGSGKSYLAKQFSGVYCSADDFMDSFNYKKLTWAHLTWAHEQCFNKFVNAIENKQGCIVDNTNITYRDSCPYIIKALSSDYIVEIVEPSTSWKFNIDELLRRNSHGVSKSTLEKMLRRWKSTEQILKQFEFELAVPFNISVEWNVDHVKVSRSN